MPLRFCCHGSWLGGALLVITALATAEPTNTAAPYSPYTGTGHATTLLWGDTHLHSNLSTDAFGFGVRLGPDEAFRLAAGDEVTSSWGQQVRLSRPLDFLVLADHGESLGMMEKVRQGDPRLIGDEVVKGWHELLNGSATDRADFRKLFFDTKTRRDAFRRLIELENNTMRRSIWRDYIDVAEAHNRPGRFTTLLGYEWSSMPGGSNLHRVVVFRDGSERVGKVLPFTSYDSDRPEDLWRFLGRYESTTGGSVLAIPHNGNLSNGMMFPVETSYGESVIDRDYAKTRMRWEPVVEVTQIKGDGEAHPLLSPDDEFADYETWDFGNMRGVKKTPEMLPGEYARSALKAGLQIEASQGANPYQFGMIGSTDSHTALATAAENNFFGKHSGVEPGPDRWKHPVATFDDLVIQGWQQVSSGYAAVWAKENSRAAIWDALKRREVYATTGSRMTVRFFGSWDFSPADAHSPDLARKGYAKGVPMGSVLPTSGRKTAPSFLIAASRDPIGANLDRIQLVKGWVDDEGNAQERVYDVVWSEPDKRKPGQDGRLPPVGNTADLKSATWSNDIGAVALATVWQDPDFYPDQHAFYYVRVLEIPTPRWTAYDAARFDITMDGEVPMTTQERAYTSPIWYAP